MKKLRLNVETLRHLDFAHEAPVHGGKSFAESNCGVPSACWPATCNRTGCEWCPNGCESLNVASCPAPVGGAPLAD